MAMNVKNTMTKEEFNAKLQETGLKSEIFANLTQFTKTTIYTWTTGKMNAPNYVEAILDLLISLRYKFLSFNPNGSILKEKQYLKSQEEEIEYYKKAISLKKENDKLKEKIKLLKSNFKEKK